jgi:hypothetical protein
MTRAWSIWSASLADRLAAALSTLILAAMLMPTVAAAPSGSGAAKGDVQLESMQIEIWPEYDRPAALVILRGELTADVGLPAAVSLRIPASSGGPAAVAFATEKKAGLLNLKYERADAADFITLRFTVPARFFHVEFYDRLLTGNSARSYKYLWPGDLPVNWLDVVLQEPAGASDISVKPDLVESSAGSDGLRYRSAQLGPYKQGTPLPIEIQYAKTGPQTSVEILKLSVSAPRPQTNISPAQPHSSWLYPSLLGTAALLIFTTAVFGGLIWLRRRWPARPAENAGYCSKCRKPFVAGDRFCSKCGAALK